MADPAVQATATARRRRTPWRSRWDGGKLTNQEVADLVMRRRLVNAFLYNRRRHGRQADRSRPVSSRSRCASSGFSVPETPEQGVEEHVVNTKLVADLARKAGMRISDETIVRYLDELGRGRVSREEMRGMIQRMPVGGGRASIAYIIRRAARRDAGPQLSDQLPVLAGHGHARGALAGLAASRTTASCSKRPRFPPRSFSSTCPSRRTPNGGVRSAAGQS